MYSPVYRGLTVQFRMYAASPIPWHGVLFKRLRLSLNRFLAMSAMVLGGFIEGDKRMVAYEKMMRHNNRIRRDAAIWRAYEEEYEASGTPGVASENGVHRGGKS